MKIDKADRERIAVVLGGIALALVCLLAIAELVREHLGIWAVPLIALLLWREFELAGMRMELGRLRSHARPVAAVLAGIALAFSCRLDAARVELDPLFPERNLQKVIEAVNRSDAQITTQGLEIETLKTELVTLEREVWKLKNTERPRSNKP